MTNTIRITVDLEEDFWKKLKILAIEERTTIKKLIIDGIQILLDKKRAEQKNKKK
jgi:predicted DNA-binding ribbon-helix-helix protein